MDAEKVARIKQARKSKKIREMKRAKPAMMKMEAKKEKVKEMLLSDESYKKIAKVIGVSKTTVRKYRKYLIEIRRGRSRKVRKK